MRKLFTSMLIAAAVFGTGYVFLNAGDAVAKPDKASKDTPTLADSLGDLSWGMSSEKTKKILEEKIMNDFRTKSYGNTDLSYVDNLSKSYQERVENMQKSYIVLTSDNTASLSVSIVGEEFMPNAGESMLTQREDIATRYYFFKEDKLYKMGVVYDTAYLGPIAFDTFVATTAAKYGPPAEENWDDDANFTDAVWKDGSNVKLTVKNKYSSYNTFLMVFADESVEKELGPVHAAYFKKVNGGPEVNSAIDALTADDSDQAGSSVDSMLGVKTEVNLLAGLSQEDIDIINGVTTKEEVEAQKKAKAKKVKKPNTAKAKEGLTIF